jgi:phosphoenolpyruvate carboxykinase (ATP)
MFQLPVFNLHVPESCPGVESKILWPRDTWSDKTAYDTETKKLASAFIRNMKKYEDKCPTEVIEKGGPTL